MFFASKEKAAERLAPIFEIMGWTWAQPERTPSREEILGTFVKLEVKMAPDSVAISTGRLVIEKLRDSGQLIYGLDTPSGDEFVASGE